MALYTAQHELSIDFIDIIKMITENSEVRLFACLPDGKCTGCSCMLSNIFCIFACFVALRPKSTAMDMVGWPVHLTTLFSRASLNKQFKPVLSAHTFACN